MGRELDVKVARALGQERALCSCDPNEDIVQFPDATWVCGLCGHKGEVDKKWRWTDFTHTTAMPHYSTDIAAAWELDGEGWRWEFEENIYPTPVGSFLDVTVWTDHGWFSIDMPFADYPTKAEAYATGRCEVFLLAMGATNG